MLFLFRQLRKKCKELHDKMRLMSTRTRQHHWRTRLTSPRASALRSSTGRTSISIASTSRTVASTSASSVTTEEFKQACLSLGFEAIPEITLDPFGKVTPVLSELFLQKGVPCFCLRKLETHFFNQLKDIYS